jgi:hypothetical protein
MNARAVLVRLLLLAFGVLLFVVFGEVALRVIYIDAGARTLGGPGGTPFEHDTIDGSSRGRFDVGRKTAGVPRVMVVGDSVTYGLGIKDWMKTWPELLARRLEVEGRPHEFAVLALPGNDMPQHLESMRRWRSEVNPDVLIYQWYVNDIEAISHRPSGEPSWRLQAWHGALSKYSYLYFVFDHRLGQFFSRPHRGYVDYLRSEFRPGTLEWTEFEREFHEFATLAGAIPKRVLMLYPQVPYRGPYPLQELHRRMTDLATAHVLEIPPNTWVRAAGTLKRREATRWGEVVFANGESGLDVETRDYLFVPGSAELVLSADLLSREPCAGTVELFAVPTKDVVALVPFDFARTAGPAEVTVRLTVPGRRLSRLAIRVTAHSNGHCGLANLKMRVDYGFNVVDLTERLNTFNTHVSTFDAHPNERAHEVLAEAAYTALFKSR